MQIIGIFLKFFRDFHSNFTAWWLWLQETNIPYNGGAPNYGSMNNSAQSQKATMRPYQINGKWYYPTTVTLGEAYDGIASWYGPKFHGKKLPMEKLIVCMHTLLHIKPCQ